MSGKHDHDHQSQSAGKSSRRNFLKAGLAAGAAVAAVGLAGSRAEAAGKGKYADPKKPALPPSDMVLDRKRTAVVVTDPQVDFLHPKGVAWGVVGKSVTEHNTVANIGRLMAAAKQTGMLLAVSPHYYFPTDKGWKFEGALEKVMHKIGMFNRKNPYTMDG
ncbi:MAG: isochorismatase family protein, partial [SAR324 cluster bacterium]|nr:isochorismatase family protein [SAR324 cluster bacterium]